MSKVEIEDGGPAFPQMKNTGLAMMSEDGRAHMDKEVTGGATLRDYFAGKVLPAVVTTTSAGQHQPLAGKPKGTSLVDAMATDAYRIADAMIAARKGGQS